MDHLRTVSSPKAIKAWIAGAMTLLAPYIVPPLSKWMATWTPDGVVAFFADKFGMTVDYGFAAVVVGLAGLVLTYWFKNKPE